MDLQLREEDLVRDLGDGAMLSSGHCFQFEIKFSFSM